MFTTITIALLLILSLVLLAWIGQLIKHSKDQEYSLDCYKLMHETQLNHADMLAEEIFSTKEETNSWIESLQQEILDLETAVRDANNELYVRKAEVEQLQWNLGTYESVCNPNSETEDELVIARRCIWDKEHQLSSLKFQVSLVKEVLLGLETKIGKEEPNLFEISSDLRWAIASISHDEIPF